MKYREYRKVTKEEKIEIKRLRAEPFCWTNKAIAKKLGLRTSIVYYHTGPKYDKRGKKRTPAQLKYQREYNKYWRTKHTFQDPEDAQAYQRRRLLMAKYRAKWRKNNAGSIKQYAKEYHKEYYKKNRAKKLAQVKALYRKKKAEQEIIKKAKIDLLFKRAKEIGLIP